jgi:hypothetical protein
VFLTYAAPGGHALIDRELYLPESWASDRGRCAAAGIPEGTVFATKPALALAMIGRALDAGTPAGWVAGDKAYGADPGLRTAIEARQMRYVLAVAKSHPAVTAAGTLRAGALARKLPPRAWQRLSAGAGAKGHRWYDWAWISIDPGVPGHRWLLIRRYRRTRELAYYRCYSPRHVPLAVLVRAAGRRWMAGEDFQASKGLAALDEHQVRRWTSWYRWTTLAMLALAFLTVAALAEHAQPPPAGLIPLTRNEIARLAAVLIIQPARDARYRLAWSAWRRGPQRTAQACRYRRQAGHGPWQRGRGSMSRAVPAIRRGQGVSWTREPWRMTRGHPCRAAAGDRCLRAGPGPRRERAVASAIRGTAALQHQAARPDRAEPRSQRGRSGLRPARHHRPARRASRPGRPGGRPGR